jgi:hypothetical protein
MEDHIFREKMTRHVEKQRRSGSGSR